MPKSFDQEILARVFSDADVVDVDFSEWDKQILLWVLADHWADWKLRKPLVAVTFKGVTQFSIELPPDELKVDDPESHLQWHLYESSVETFGEIIRLRVTGMPCAPKLTVDCRRIEFDEYPNHILDKINPGWNRPASGLARLGILKLAAKIR